MNVLMLRSSTGMYGAESVLLGLLPELQRLAVRPRLVCIQDHTSDNRDLFNAARDRSIAARLLPCRSRLDFKAIRELRRDIRDGNTDVVHTHDPKSTLFGLLATLGLNLPIVSTLHGWVDTTRRMQLYNRIEGVLLRACQRVVIVAPPMLPRLRKMGVPESKVQVIGNGVDTERFQPASRSVDGLRFLTVARLASEKALDMLLRAFARISESNGSCSLTIVGAGPLEQELKQLRLDLGLQDSVKFAGFIEDPRAFFDDANCYVCCSHTEGMPLSVLEAMASGLPVIATRVGSLPEMVSPDINGWLVEPGDESALAGAMAQAASDSERLNGFGAASREVATTKYSIGRQAADYSHIFDSLSGNALQRKELGS